MYNESKSERCESTKGEAKERLEELRKRFLDEAWASTENENQRRESPLQAEIVGKKGGRNSICLSTVLAMYS